MQQTKGPGSRRTTIKDVAAAVGVAASTVSNAYNRPDQLSAALRDRIFAEAERLGYGGPNPIARGLRTRSSGVVGVLLGGPLTAAYLEPIAAATLLGISEELAAEQLALTLVPPQTKTGLPAADGVIVLCEDADDPLLERAIRQGMPVVLIDSPPDFGAPSVAVDDTIAARGAAGHLIAMGHTRIGIIVDRIDGEGRKGRCTEERLTAVSRLRVRARLEGYRLAIEAGGLDWADVAVIEAGGSAEEDGAEAATLLLQEGVNRPTAILATSDALAAGALVAARALGIEVPAQLSIVGFDDTLLRVTTPALTTVRQPHRQKGRRAAKMLLAQLRNEEPPPLDRLSPKLVVRASSGPAPTTAGPASAA
jgi:DNA-binding LacI/PurR family transcriptional regulator